MSLGHRSLTGRDRIHVVDVDDLGGALHPEVVEPLRAMRETAAGDGIDVRVVSGFRDFDRQLRIWNAKFRGELPIFDRAGREVERWRLRDDEAIDAILTWSALPGASRHHWGTDLDIVDAAGAGGGYEPRLVAAEFGVGGPFARLGTWLDENLDGSGFFRPYDRDRGVAPEPWHVSYAPVAVEAQAALTREMIADAIGTADMARRDLVLERLDELMERYVTNVASHG